MKTRRFTALATTFALAFAGCSESSTTTAETPDPGATDESIAESGETFTRENYRRLVSEPNAHKGASVEIVGQVFMVEQDADASYIQMFADPEDSEWNTIVVTEPGFEVDEEDYLSVQGVVREALEGENAFGGSVSAPIVDAARVEVVTAAAMHPTVERLRRQSETLGGVTITVSKVEVADEQTRVFVKAQNDSGADFQMDTDPGVVSGGKQVKSADTFDTGYPELAFDLSPGASTDGVLLFEAIDPDEPLAISFEGYDVDFNEIKWEFNW